MKILRLITAGSVDDGKSTLIGRLLYDTKQLLSDQVSNLELASKKKGIDHLDFSLLTDGLKEEREQGITIDVAYRYMATKQRKYILADTPGHFEYTRNFITACSTSEIALLMVDATKGVFDQTRRHAFLASMMGLNQIVFCINKMDAVEYNENVYKSICSDIKALFKSTTTITTLFIPISALHGDNVVSHSANMSWYNKETLLDYLERTTISESDDKYATMPVQTIIQHNDSTNNGKLYAGLLTSGIFRKDDDIIVYPMGITTTITKIYNHGLKVDQVQKGASISLQLANNISIARGNIIAHPKSDLRKSTELTVLACWLDTLPMQLQKKYIVRLATQEKTTTINSVTYKINIHSFSKDFDVTAVEMNDIVCLNLTLDSEIVYNNYSNDKYMGALILVDSTTNNTVAACTIS